MKHCSVRSGVRPTCTIDESGRIAGSVAVDRGALEMIMNKWFTSHRDVFGEWDMRRMTADAINFSSLYDVDVQYLFIRVDYVNGKMKRTSINADPVTVPSMLAECRQQQPNENHARRDNKIVFFMELPPCSVDTTALLIRTCRGGRGYVEKITKSVRCAINNGYAFRLAAELFDPNSMYYQKSVATELAEDFMLAPKLKELVRSADGIQQLMSRRGIEVDKRWWVSPPWITYDELRAGERRPPLPIELDFITPEDMQQLGRRFPKVNALCFDDLYRDADDDAMDE